MLSRIDGSTDLDQLALVTGLTAVRLEAILERLVREGAVEAPRGAPPATPPPSPSGPDPFAEERDRLPEEETGEQLEAGSAAASPRLLFEARLHQLPEDTRAGLAGYGPLAEPRLGD